jgi:hypothetical protein
LEADLVDKLLAPLWTDGDVERRWGKQHGYMSSLRARGLGPAFLRLGPRTFRYRPENVVAYEDQQTFDSNSAAMATDFRAPPSPFEDVETPVNRRIAPVHL